MSLLYVEDNPDDQLLFRRACEDAGLPLSLHVATSAREAVSYLGALLLQWKEAATPLPALIVVDKQLRGSSSFEVINYVRRTPGMSHLPVVLLTGSACPGDEADSTLSGADACLLKPCGFTPTVELVRQLYRLAIKLSTQMTTCCKGT